MTDVALFQPDVATERQIRAADPKAHVWVSANAGSGKTRVLTDRVARLLLSEVPPQNVLCLTYTKAAASEMQNRLFKRLGGWAMLPDAALERDLARLGVDGPFDSDRLARARRLFARAIEAPGGLRIQTIHAFCASLLRRFPLEAGISPQFQEMDDRAGALMREEIMDDLVRSRPDLVAPVAARHNGENFDKFLAAVVNESAFGDLQEEDTLSSAIGLPAGWDDSLPLRIAWQGGEDGLAKDVRDAFSSASQSYQDFAENLCEIDHSAPSWAGLDRLCSLFLYSKDKSSKSRNFPDSRHKKAVEAVAHLAEDLHGWMDRVEEANVVRNAIQTYRDSLALQRFGHAFQRLYSERKSRDALLDFDDLIRKALALLTDRGVAQWVLFKLDGGIDHILVDEAQDTSAPQWAVIRRLTEEFATGFGARTELRRTLFVVGDKKQSIYSFQGADPEAFEQMRAHFEGAFEDADDRLDTVPLLHSFRSSPAVLDCVDATFRGAAADGVEDDIGHVAFKSKMPGRVDLWPVVEKDKEKAKDPPWFTPLDRPAPQDPQVVLAETIATRIRAMIDDRVEIPVSGNAEDGYLARPVNEGDFLVLVRRRSTLFHHIIRACKGRGLNVAGADRLKIGGELAVKDLAALMRFLALPEDDLSLAGALRSPLFGWSEQALYSLAHHRPEGQHLWEALRRSRDDHPDTLAMLDDLRREADFLRPFDLIDRVLNRWDGRRRLLARLGEEAEDGIDELLSQALNYERTHVPSLTGFVGWMQSDDVEIKRQLEGEGDKIRVMTVHGAKGLEAPIVILPDCTKPKWDERDDIIPMNGTAVWKPKSDATPPSLRTELDARKARQMREWRRLLYVAMTRAESWLIVGAAGDVGGEGESWYRLVETGLDQLAAIDVEAPTGTGLRHQSGDWNGMGPADVRASTRVRPVDLPEFGKLSPPENSAVLSPSDLGGAKSLPGEPEGDLDGDGARVRGTLLHLLLEHLPQYALSEREGIAEQLVSIHAGELPVSDGPVLIKEAIGLISAPEIAPIFGGDSRAEVTLSAVIMGRVFHGAIDRLVIGPSRVLAVDYKSNHRVPDRARDTPEGILRQMGAYQAMLQSIWPDREIEVAVLWTRASRLMSLDAELVSSALARVKLP